MINWEPGITLEIAEKIIILQAYRFYKNNKTQTAQSLDMAIRTLDSKLEKYESDDREHRNRIEEIRRKNDEFLERQRKGTQSIPSAHTGVRVESSTQITAEQILSVPERPEVQEMLQGQAPKGRPKKTSASI